MIFIDTNVLAIELIHKNNKDYTSNKQFLEIVQSGEGATTSIFNILELCAVASNNLPQKEIDNILSDFHCTKWIEILYPQFNNTPSGSWFFNFFLKSTFERIKRKVPFDDAMILVIAEEHSTTKFVTWNKKDFTGRTSLPVLNPKDYLEEITV